MQISKFPLWICALALCGGVTLHAQDNAAQAAARAALLQKMQEINGAPPAASPAPAPAQPALAPAAPAAVAPAVEIPAATTVVPAATTAPTAVETPAPAVATPAAAGTLAPAGDTPAQVAARAALLQKMQEIGGNPSTATSSAAATPAPAVKVETTTPGRVAVAQPIVAPALPIALSKEQKLNALLSSYKADQLTPQQYHEQRAAILAEP